MRSSQCTKCKETYLTVVKDKNLICPRCAEPEDGIKQRMAEIETNIFNDMVSTGSKIMKTLINELNNISNFHIRKTPNLFRRKEDMDEMRVALCLYEWKRSFLEDTNETKAKAYDYLKLEITDIMNDPNILDRRTKISNALRTAESMLEVKL